MIERVRVGDMVFVAEGQEGIGAVRAIHGGHFTLYVENAGEFDIPRHAILRVHDQKVMLDPKALNGPLLEAVRKAHNSEDPKLTG
jgi:hypothetical protein